MLAERILTPAIRGANARALRLGSAGSHSLPPARPGGHYMLYAHIPFCERLCPYCSFNRFPFTEDRARPYFRDLREEMRRVADLGYDFTSMYVGGGTPTVLVDELSETIDLATALFSIKEVSTETNPNHLVPEIVEPLRERVHRFSVGVQSFDDGLLKQMDRYDKYGSGEFTLERLQWVADKFHSVNVDMIFNFPSQTEAMLRRDVEAVKESGCNQTTFYPLMASPVVSRSLKRTVGKVDYAREARYYRMLSEGLADTFEPASAWTFSRIRGGMIDEYILDYEEYVGVGSGAFSYLQGGLYVDSFSLRDYQAAVEGGSMGVAAKRTFSRRDQMRYRFLMGLFGLSLDKHAFARDFGTTPERGLPAEWTFMRAVGAFERDDAGHATLTAKGRYLLVAMMREFFIGVNNVRDQARAALAPDERQLLFGEGEACASALGQAAGRAEAVESQPPAVR